MKPNTQTPPIEVIFKMEGKGKEATPIAFFPNSPGTNSPYTCTCLASFPSESGTGKSYMEHGYADTHYASSLKPATPEQYAPLMSKLRRQGYENVKPVRKFLRKHLDARKVALRKAGYTV